MKVHSQKPARSPVAASDVSSQLWLDDVISFYPGWLKVHLQSRSTEHWQAVTIAGVHISNLHVETGQISSLHPSDRFSWSPKVSSFREITGRCKCMAATTSPGPRDSDPRNHRHIDPQEAATQLQHRPRTTLSSDWDLDLEPALRPMVSFPRHPREGRKNAVSSCIDLWKHDSTLCTVLYDPS
jgi:hypothetical protein